MKGFKTASDPIFRQSVTEDVMHAYYQGDKALHPWAGETEPAFTGWDGEQKYSWVKAPRFDGEPMQVGPLAQVLIGYAQGHPLTRKYTDLAIEKIAAIGGVRATPAALHSTPRPPCRSRHSRMHAGGVGTEAFAIAHGKHFERRLHGS